MVVVAAATVTVTAAQSRHAQPTPITGGRYEASGVIGVAGTDSVLFVDDNHSKHIFLLRFSASGVQVGDAVAVPIQAEVPDMEDITSDGEFIYVVGSQSKGGKRADGLVRFRFDPATRAVSSVERAAGLRQMLAAAVPELADDGHRARSDLNIEGLVWDPAASRLLLGLRSPMSGADALLVPLRLRDPRAPLTSANLAADPVIRLDLSGLAIRGLGYDAARRTFLVLAGASTAEHTTAFHLLEWGGPQSRGALRDEATFPAREKPEGVTRMMLGGQLRTVIVFDSSGYLVE